MLVLSMLGSCVLALAVLCAAPVSARSNGLLGYCDLTPQIYPKTGLQSQLWPNGRFGKNKTSGASGLNSGVMNWCDAPTASSFYTIRSGDVGAVGNDPTTYTPGGTLTEIHLRVFDLQRRFIGLVLYATNSSGSTVLIAGNPGPKEEQIGEWVIPRGAPFQVPASCGGHAVTHSDSNLKQLHTRFFWSAPVGTGTVRFRVLIKQGEQNKGSFFWPVRQLTLREGPAPLIPILPAQSGNNTNSSLLPGILPLVGEGVRNVVVGEFGMACADVCRYQSPQAPYCHERAIKEVKNLTALASVVKGKTACRLPMLSACPYAGAPRVTLEGYCSFRSEDAVSSCPYSLRPVVSSLNSSEPLNPEDADASDEPDVCYTSPTNDAQAICVCTNNKAFLTVNPYTAAAEAQRGAAATVSSRSSVLIALVAGLVALVSSTGAAGSPLFRPSHSSLLVLSVLAVLALLSSPVSAHNYIKSQHRAFEAAVSTPCQARVGTQPHVQVIANQWFEVEWSVGHGDYTVGPFWFVWIPESAYLNLKADNITSIIKDYIKLAPLSAYKNMSTDAPLWEKHHLHLNTEQSVDSYFKEPVLDPSDPSFIVRDPVYMGKLHPSQYGTSNAAKIIQTRFTDAFVAKDKRVSYASGKYPWIEAIDQFENPFVEHTIYNNQATLARFKLPARAGPGNYIGWFYWSGYRDCIDINVRAGSSPVENRYGLPSSQAAPAVVKQDHCEFTYVSYARTLTRRLPPSRSAEQCINDCIARGYGGCTAVQVVRAKNPPAALPYTVNWPLIPYVYNETKINSGEFNPCGMLSVHDRTINGCKAAPSYNARPTMFTPNLTSSDYICYGLIPSRNQDNQVEEDYQIATEPADPVFYSTCFQLVPAGGFLDVPPISYTVPDWSTGDACLDCSFHANLTRLNYTQVADWQAGLTAVGNAACRDCSIVESQASAPVIRAQLSGPNQPYSGVEAPPAPADGGTPAGTSSDANLTSVSGLAAQSPLVMGLVIAGLVGALFGLGLGAFFCVRRMRSKQSTAQTNMSKMTVDNFSGAAAGTELTSNPALRQW